MTDTERIDALQALLGQYTGRVCCRWSTCGRGWRLHETSRMDASEDVRVEIDRFIEQKERP